MTLFQTVKQFLVDLTDLSKDALHIHVGLAVMLAVMILFRKSLSDWRPIAAVAVASIAGELWDLVDAMNQGDPIEWKANWRDIKNTVFWPAILFLLARFTRVLRR